MSRLSIVSSILSTFAVAIFVIFAPFYAAGAAGETHLYLLTKPIEPNVTYSRKEQAAVGAVVIVKRLGEFWVVMQGVDVMMDSRLGHLYRTVGEVIGPWFGVTQIDGSGLIALEAARDVGGSYFDYILLSGFYLGVIKRMIGLPLTLAPFKKLPGTRDIFLLGASQLRVNGMLNISPSYKGYVLVDSEDPELDKREDLKQQFGPIVRIENTRDIKFQLRLSLQGELHGTPWNTSLTDFYMMANMPENIADDWSAALKSYEKTLGRFRRFLIQDAEIVVDMTLPDGTVLPNAFRYNGRDVRKVMKELPLPKEVACRRALATSLSGASKGFWPAHPNF